MDTLKEAAANAIDSNAGELNFISQEIWLHPELGFAETRAHQVLTDYLEKHGFAVERHYVVDTAFKAVYGSAEGGKPNVAVICEYDALPEIGHACGHNLIAEVGVATALGIKAAFQAADKPLGQVTVLGTPAEEGGGGKVVMMQQGALSDLDLAMMAHPTDSCSARPTYLARDKCVVTYHGRASHAAEFPWDGINALDAAVLSYQNVSCLRQQFKPTWRVHGVIRKGGIKPNIIPALTELEYYMRAPAESELEVLRSKMEACFQAAATATGCTMEVAFHPIRYSNMVSNTTLADIYQEEATAMGVTFPTAEMPALGSTDMGNVSHAVPSIHPNFYIGSSAANHTVEFNTAAGSLTAQPYTLKTAKALAYTALAVYRSPELLQQVKLDFDKDKSRF